MANGLFYDANGATLSGTFVVSAGSIGCIWQYTESPLTSFNIRQSGTGPAGGATCGGSPITVTGMQLNLSTAIISGIRYWVVELTADGTGTNDLFYGTTPFADCKTSLTISNQSSSTNVATGGTATVTFCV